MPDENFGPLLAFTDVETGVLDHYRHWMEIWLAARERKLGLPFDTIQRPRSYIVKQTFTALPGEERTPIVICVSDGLATEPTRRGDGHYEVAFRFGIVGVVLAVDGVRARALAGHYQAAMLGIALKHQKVAINGDDCYAKLADFSNIRIEDIDDEAAGRSMAAVRLELTYEVDGFAEDKNPPDYIPPVHIPPDPPVDPGPQPDDPIVEEVIVETDRLGG